LASIPLYYVSRLASKSVKVVLSGEGSDEVLGGYDFNLLVQVWDRHRRLARIPHFLRSGAALRLVESISPRLVQDLRNADVPMDYRTVQPPPNMTNYMSSQDKITLMGNGTGFADTMLPLKDDLDRLGQCDPLHQLLYAFCQSWLVEDLLMKADKMAMANSLELRTPFLDYRLVEWAARSPAWVKVGRDNGGYATKRILRRFARNILPEKIITRPKQGFPVPVYDWLTSRLKSWAIELLTSSDSRLRHHFVPREVDRLMMLGIDETGTLLDKHRLWNILILELWMREWIPV
jgi:asparagine synthase (glutamine-hydrolysing)